MPTNPEKNRLVPVGPFQINFENRLCRDPKQKITHLSNRELQILSRLSTVQFRTAESLACSVALEAYSEVIQKLNVDPAMLMTENNIHVIVHDLRQKLGEEYFELKQGFGYRLKAE